MVKLSNSVNQYYLYVVDMVPRCAQTDAGGAQIDMFGTWTDICHRHGAWMHPDRCRWHPDRYGWHPDRYLEMTQWLSGQRAALPSMWPTFNSDLNTGSTLIFPFHKYTTSPLQIKMLKAFKKVFNFIQIIYSKIPYMIYNK